MAKQKKAWTLTPQQADAEAKRLNKEAADRRAQRDKEHDDLIKKVKSDTTEAKKRAVKNSLNPTSIYRALNQTR